MQDNKLPTWCELVPQERHQLLGELVDAMIYSPVAVMNVQAMLKVFKSAGYVKSTILPHLNTTEDGNNLSGY